MSNIMSTEVKNTSFIDTKLPTEKSRNEDKDAVVDAGLGVRHIFVFLGKRKITKLSKKVFIFCRIYWICQCLRNEGESLSGHRVHGE